ncbi:MAG: cyclophilin family peptidyl-prolyl cis-trans isomerase PpiB [Algoriphagus marincola HL-49]|uniref:Peptidyl-prolyl cis-trans isomerase n=1 Tax=Algoriphagus marincola HL-49 TaxID=1305737 RepID=A0A0P8AJ83_9BACT|nr:MAG: cyclophilin family peptidyl-prolyl cis-trans isomerase PpiB [Algoriphagus marincola HL-49]
MSYKSFLGIALSVFAMLGCAGQKEQVIRIDTRYGEIVAVLFDDTPVHKSNFLELAEAGRFDSTEFHRVIPDFMVQGGDVFSKEKMPAEEWPTLPAEILPHHFHRKGMIAAARQGNNINPEKRSSGSQFYIVLGEEYTELELTTDMPKLQAAFMQYVQLQSQDSLRMLYNQLYEQEAFDSLTQVILSKRDEIEQSLNMKLTKEMSAEQIQAYTTVGGTPHLDGEYTVFGEVISGIDVADKISQEPRASRDRPMNPVYMTVKVESMSRSQIEREFGYVYQNEK